MKIGYDAQGAFSKKSRFGYYNKYIVKLMGKYVPENNYLLYTAGSTYNKELLDIQSFPNLEIRTPAKIISRMNMGTIWRSAILGNTALNDNVDIFHGLSNQLPIVISKRLKTVVTIHDLYFIRYPHLYQPLEIEILKRRIKHACRIANKIIAVNKQTAEDIHAFLGIQKNKIEVIYPGCDQCFSVEHDLFELKKTNDLYKLPEDYILNFTPLESASGTLSVLKALSTIEDKVDIPLVVVEHPSRSYKKEILEEATRLGLENRLIFLKNVPREDLSKIYQLSQLFIYLASYEGSVTPIIEALNAKVPVITSPGFENAGGEATIYIKNKDHEALGEAITKVLLNTQLASKMIFEGERHARQFDDKQVAERISNVYESLYENPEALH